MNNYGPRKSVVGLAGFGASKCQSHLARMTNINVMIERVVGGDTSALRRGVFEDVSSCPDTMMDCLNSHRRAVEAYNALPESVRLRFPTPEVFLEAAQNPDMASEFVRLGLSVERSPDKPIEVKVINQSVANATETH